MQGLPEWSVGFVYLPALVLLSLLSSLTAPIGARLAHRLPVAHAEEDLRRRVGAAVGQDAAHRAGG